MVVWLVLAVPFHSAPGVEEFHTKPEFHVNGSGMGPDCAGNALALAMVFSLINACEVKGWDSVAEALHGSCVLAQCKKTVSHATQPSQPSAQS
jgi:hypothetical protein